MIWIPSVSEILRLHSKLISMSGGSDGVRDLGLIESAIARAQSGFGSFDLYPDVESKAAALCCGLAKNHGFIDGNKRIGTAALLLVLAKNGYELRFTQSELVALGLGVATSLTVADVVKWIQAHSATRS